MLTFFRRIRRSFVNAGDARKSLLYAIGEIALVVIGILIALQINNWNEDRKSRTLEHKMLIEVLENMRRDTNYINSQLDRSDRAKTSIDYLLNKPGLHDSLTFHFQQIFIGLHLAVNRSAFESLKSSGLQLISNDSVRNQITGYYQYVQFLMSSIDKDRDYFIEHEEIPFALSEFHREINADTGYWYIPNDYNRLVEKQRYNDYLLGKRNLLKTIANRYQNLKQNNIECSQVIRDYLETK